MTQEAPGSGFSTASANTATGFPLLKALIERRSRRFGRGFYLNGGSLSYQSKLLPHPLTQEEEALLVFAACGITGQVLAELPYESGEVREGGTGNIITHLVGRTFASGDAIHSLALFVLNDQGSWFIQRPQDYPRSELGSLVIMAQQHKMVELYEQSRVKIASNRLEIPREVPFCSPFNKWSANQPGSTYFLPVAELSALYINILLAGFSDEHSYFILDERNGFRPAGLSRFARSKGGHLYDNPDSGRVGTVSLVESWLHEFVAIEQGKLLQNLALMTEALGLGGFPHFAAHLFAWPQALGFRMEQIPFSTTIGAKPWLKGLLKLLKKDQDMPTAVGLEHNGKVLLKPFCPPYYPNMAEAVQAFVDYKFAQNTGTLRDNGGYSPWNNGAKIQSGIPRYSDHTIEATVAYCDYIYKRYGRFPASTGPFRTTLAHQAQHLDLDFYDRFYKPGAYTEGHRLNFNRDGKA